MRTNTIIALLLGFMINAVLYGSLVTLVMTFDATKPYWEYLIPAVVVISLVTTPFVAKALAPKMRLQGGKRPDLGK